MKTPSITVYLILFATCASAATSPGADSILMEFSVQRDRIMVTPAGDPTRRFPIDPERAQWRDDRWVVSERLILTPDTLFLDGAAYPSQRLGHLEIDTERREIKVRLYDRGPGARVRKRNSNRTGLAEHLQVTPGEFVRGYVLNFGGDVKVAGEVNRSVVSLGGDIFVEDGAVVRGSVVSLGGDVHKTEAAQVYGDLYADNRQRFKPRWYEDPDQNVFNFNARFEYNRVTGALPWGVLKIGPDYGSTPQFLGDAGYAFQSELWHYRIGIGRMQDRGPIYYAGWHRETKNDDLMRVRRNENTFYALLFSADYRDYYFGEGFNARLGWSFGEGRRLHVGYVNELLSPLQANTSQWSLFGSSFPPNYDQLLRSGDTSLAADVDGRLVFVEVGGLYRYPAYEDPESGSWQVGLATEYSGVDINSDVDYSRYYGWLTRRQPLWYEQSLNIRAVLGGAGGTLPATRFYYLGGIGSLRGYDYKEFFGDRYWLLNLEYVWSLGAWQVFALYDAGQVGADTNWTAGPVRYNFGAGFSIRQAFRVQLAWAPGESGRKPLVTVRFVRPF
jgi:hypothetical protein